MFLPELLSILQCSGLLDANLTQGERSDYLAGTPCNGNKGRLVGNTITFRGVCRDNHADTSEPVQPSESLPRVNPPPPEILQELIRINLFNYMQLHRLGIQPSTPEDDPNTPDNLEPPPDQSTQPEDSQGKREGLESYEPG